MNAHITIKRLLTPLLALLLYTSAAHTVRADDIDIYLNPTASPASVPVVMFTLDYRSNLGATVCSGGACSFLTSQTYKNASNVDVPYLTLSGGTTSYFNLLRASLKYVLQEVGSSGVKIGLAMSHEQKNNCEGPSRTGCSNGGYIVAGAKPLTTQVDRDAFYAKLDALPVPGGTVAHPYQGKELFFELFRYFSGQGWYNMRNGWDDRGTNNTYNINEADDYSPADATIPASWDATVVSGANYVSPVTGACGKLYTVNILFQVSQQEDDSDAAIKAPAASGGMGGINLTGSNNSFKTVIKWMYDNDSGPAGIDGTQNVTSYFIVDSTKVNTTTRGYAGAGVGASSAEPFVLSSDPEALIDTLSAIFRNILSVSTSFVAPSVAVNVYNRAQTLNDVFIAMFQADENGFPSWPGNLKKFRIGANAAGDPEIQDANNAYAVASDGRIKFDALSYWTIAGDLPAAPPAPAITDIVTGKDGRIINRGGSGSKIPGYKLKCTSTTDTSCKPGDYTPGLINDGASTVTNVTARKLFYDPVSFTSGDTLSSTPLNADVATATALQASLGATTVGTCAATDSTSPPTACYLLKYARGLLNDGTTVRSWLMGDLLHSRPLAINYGGSTTNPDIRIFAGGNDGFFRMLRNTGGSANAGAEDGVEAWAFMPRAVMPKIKDLAANIATTPAHPYLADGSPAIFVLDNNGDGNIVPTGSAPAGGDKVVVYFGLRRGGKAYYALDISNPDNPKILWRIEKGAAGTDFAELGQTWSTPRVTLMFHSGYTTAKPVLIFGGGYDANKDTHPGHGAYTGTGLGADDSEGNAIFIVDAETGALVWKAVKGATAGYSTTNKAYSRTDMNDSIPSEVAVIDSNGNGLADRLYVGDTGGVMWRVDMLSNDQANWTIKPIFSIGRHSVSPQDIANDRRFFYPPDYVQSKDAAGAFDAVILGTGDRENPRDTDVKNWFYMYKDRNTNSGFPGTGSAIVHTDFGDVTDNCLQDNSCGTPPDLINGWRMALTCPPSNPSACGEKNLAPALTLLGSIYFTTFLPPGSSTSGCSLSEGNGLLYIVSLQNGTAVQNLNTSNDTSSGSLFTGDRYTSLASAGIPAEVTSLGGGLILRPDLKIDRVTSNTGIKTFWYQKYR